MTFLSLVTLFCAVVSAAPSGKLGATLHARQAGEACAVGYCTENGGTTGGAGGKTVTVTDVDSLVEAAGSDEPLTIIVSGSISGSAKVRVKSDKTIFGEAGSSLTGVGLYVRKVNNVILRNLKIALVPADNGDAIGLDNAVNVWVDHCDLSGDLNADKDEYDGLLDITHASDFVTVSNTYLHNHWKAMLIGHSDSNASEDTGALHVTLTENYWEKVNSRCPSVRFGTVHIINNYWDTISASGVNSRMGAQVLVQSSAFANSNEKAILSADSAETGFVVVDDVDLGGSANTAPAGTLTPDSLPYSAIAALGSGSVAGSVPGSAGQIL
ncbi:pectate lyase domain-containing protein [Sarocladium implicatum]|nr:pectate lyase domain-containing protein [Sarocladium implicatum]